MSSLIGMNSKRRRTHEEAFNGTYCNCILPYWRYYGTIKKLQIRQGPAARRVFS